MEAILLNCKGQRDVVHVYRMWIMEQAHENPEPRWPLLSNNREISNFKTAVGK
jgi:hypothetical protein